MPRWSSPCTTGSDRLGKTTEGAELKRDLDLVRRILLDLEEAVGPLDADAFTADAVSREKVGYHLQIMDEAGLIVATVRQYDNDPYYHARAERLTWAGCEYLASVRDGRAWSEAKRKMAKLAVDAPLPVVQELVTSIVKANLGL